MISITAKARNYNVNKKETRTKESKICRICKRLIEHGEINGAGNQYQAGFIWSDRCKKRANPTVVSNKFTPPMAKKLSRKMD